MTITPKFFVLILLYSKTLRTAPSIYSILASVASSRSGSPFPSFFEVFMNMTPADKWDERRLEHSFRRRFCGRNIKRRQKQSITSSNDRKMTSSSFTSACGNLDGRP
jgi:hypothetical protein